MVRRVGHGRRSVATFRLYVRILEMTKLWLTLSAVDPILVQTAWSTLSYSEPPHYFSCTF